MATMQDLYNYLQDLILTKEYKNKLLQNQMKINFGEKGLPINTPMLLFGDNLSLTEISKMELICFTKTSYEVLNIEILNPKKYFSHSELLNLEYNVKTEYTPKNIVFENVYKDPNRLSYMANYVPVEYLASLMNNRLIRYNHETQRQARYKKRKGKEFKEISLNKKSVDEIANEMLSGKFPSNQITFNILLMDNKIPQVSYVEDERRLIITPELDIDNPNTTAVDCTDGWHRLSACVAANQMAKEQGLPLNSTLTVRIEMLTLQEAKEDLIRNSKQNPIDTTYIESIKDKGFNELIQEMSKYASREKNIFYENIAKTDYEKIQTGKIVSINFLNKLFKEYNIKSNNIIENKMLAQKICKISTDLYNLYSHDIEEILKFALEIKDIEGILENSDEYIERIKQFSMRGRI